MRAGRNDSESDTFDYNPEDDQEPAFKPEVPARSKSKRKSAQNAKLRFRESNSDDDYFLMKRYFQKEEKQSSLLSSIKTKMEKSTIDDDITNIKKQKRSEEEHNKSGISQLHQTEGNVENIERFFCG